MKLPDAHLPAERGVRPLPPLVLQVGDVGGVVALDQHVARVDGLPEVDDGVITLVVIVSSVSHQSRPRLPAAARSRLEFGHHVERWSGWLGLEGLRRLRDR